MQPPDGRTKAVPRVFEDEKVETTMEVFGYFEPKTVAETCVLLAKYENAKILAGGASLVVLLKNKLVFPDRLINLKTVDGLDRIDMSSQGDLQIGALCRHRDIENSPVIRERFEVLSEAASRIASPPIRNMGTIGGNICHAEPSADFPPALIALHAKLKIIGAKGTRTLSIDEFFTDYYENILEHDEVLTEIIIPPLPPRAGGCYLKLDKTTNSAAIVGVGSVIGLDDKGICLFAGLGVAGVAATPLAIQRAADLIGKPITESSISAVATHAIRQARPISTVHASEGYRKEMVGVLTKRALTTALEKARQQPKKP